MAASGVNSAFEVLYKAASHREIEAVIGYDPRTKRTKIIARVDEKVVDSELVRKDESFDRSATRLHKRMKKDGIL
jgi:hypothetical protein